MATLTISTTGVAPNAAGDPAEAHRVESVDHRRYFGVGDGAGHEVVVVALTAEQAREVAYDLLAQAQAEDVEEVEIDVVA